MIRLNKGRIRAGTAFVVAILAAACVSRAPQPRLYTLSPTAVEGGAATGAIAVIGPFELPGYLDRPQMVTRASDAGVDIDIDESHRWAEPLAQLFVRTLAANIARRSGSPTVVPHPATGLTGRKRRISGSIQRFDVDTGGMAVLEVQWHVTGSSDSDTAFSRRSRYEAAAADPVSRADRARALESTLAAFAEDITEVLAAP